MSNTKHTPGPWKTVRNEDGTLELGGSTVQSTGIYSEAGFGLIAEVIYKKTNILGDSKKLQYETFEANARLIAAAPELLEALEMAYKAMGDSEDADGFDPKVFTKIESSIAKAKGTL